MDLKTIFTEQNLHNISAIIADTNRGLTKSELERHLRIDENVLKFMTIKDSSLPELEDYIPEARSEQQKPDALDVLLGFATY